MELRQSSQKEELEKAKIERLRREHSARLARIMNEHERTYGMDYDFLQKQIDEKKAKIEAEEKEEKEYEKQYMQQQRLLQRMIKEEVRTREQIRKETNEFNATNMTAEHRREYDIEHPEAFQDEDDPNNPAICGLKFSGSDPGAADREKRQIEQLKRWQQQQIAEKQNQKALELEEEKKWQRRYLQNDALFQANAERERQIRLQMQIDLNEENKALAAEKARRDAAERQADADEQEKMENYLRTCPFMTESREQAVGRNGKLVTQNYKGMTSEQKLAIMNEQREQKLAADRKRQEEEARIRKEEAERQKQAREEVRKQKAEMRAKKEAERQLANEYKERMNQAREEKEKREEEYGDNQPTDEFWKYFGSSHR